MSIACVYVRVYVRACVHLRALCAHVCVCVLSLSHKHAININVHNTFLQHIISRFHAVKL